MTLRIVKNLNLEDNEVFILNSRKIKGIPPVFASLDLEYKFDYFPFFTISELPKMKWIFSRKIIREWDYIINTKIVGKFIFYAQNGRHYKYRIISSHPNCEEVNYFEDGIDFYMTLDEFSKKYNTPLKKRYQIINALLGTFLGVYSRIYQDAEVFPNPNGNSLIYLLTNTSAQYLTDIIPEPFVLTENRAMEHMLLPSNSTLICFSALEEQGIVSNEHMMKGYLEFLKSSDYVLEGYLYLRFHPAQNDITRSYIMEVLKDFHIKIIADEIIIEEFIANQINDFKILGCGSSILNYALFLNEKVECFALYMAIEKFSGLTKRSSQWRDTLLNNRRNLRIWIK